MEALKRFSEKVADIWPLTQTGNLLLAASIYFLGVWGGSGNLYAFSFAFLSFLVLFILVADGRFQAYTHRNTVASAESSRAVFARLAGQSLTVHAGDSKVHLFYRFHYVLRGKQRAGRDAVFYVRTEGVSADGRIQTDLDFPYSGPADLQGKLYIKDIFGLTRSAIGEKQSHRILVQAPFFPEKPPVRFDSASSMETSRLQVSADEEKYYMREYIPGDRIKDINWKASIRLDELITRISPQAPEESHLISVEVRPYSSAKKDGPVEILHLNYLKSWVLSFIRAVQRDHPNYRFHVETGHEVLMIESPEDTDHLAAVLASLTYRSEQQRTEEIVSQEHFVFTTQFDPGLAGYTARHKHLRMHIFRTAGGSKNVRTVRFIPDWKLTCLPGLWMFRRKPRTGPGPQIERGNLLDENLKLRFF